MITLTITGETMKEVMDKLSGYGFTLPQSAQAPVIAAYDDRMNAAIPAPIAPPPATPARIPTGAPFVYTPVAVASPTIAAAPVTPPPAAPIAPPPPPLVPTTTAKAYTLDDIGRAGSGLLDTRPDLMPQLMALIASYGVPSIDKLRPDQLGAVAIELRALGANI